MDATFGLVMLVGKYLFLGLIYLFLYWAFRGLFAQLAAEAPPVARAAAVARPTPTPATGAAPAAAPAPAAPAPVRPVAAASAPVAAAAPAPVAAPPVPAVAVLAVQDPGQSNLKPGQVITLTAALTIGRAEDNGLVLQDKFCSQHHAMIFLQQGQRLLRDRNSTNGTYVNGTRVTGDTVLQSGDRVGFGTALFEYRAAH